MPAFAWVVAALSPSGRLLEYGPQFREGKSSYGDGNGGDCAEVACGGSGVVAVRDSKVPSLVTAAA
ncbi:DUF397 domain-containing protein [Streptomyces sp. NPDC042207]|uniref:DUF397 domain-containing protein n=1 Tax=Streptomyces sp. NPDC042207 TaxID=3154331 RepID=UPI00340ABAE5